MNKIQVLLRCGDWIDRPCEPRPVVASEWNDDGDRFHCRYGHGEQDVTAIRTHQWRVRCQSCRFGGWFGQDKAGARMARDRHMRKEPTHSASVAYDKVTADGRGTILRWDDHRPTPGRKMNV